MEDVDLVRRLNRVGRLEIAEKCVVTAARRWEGDGILYTTVRNWSLMVKYLLGASPHRLRRHYDDRR